MNTNFVISKIQNSINNLENIKQLAIEEIQDLKDFSKNYQEFTPNIITPNLKFKGNFTQRTNTKYIILHHRAGYGTVESLHQDHLSRGWAGIGYHLYIDLKGNICKGRAHYAQGAHCLGWNQFSLGICFEGDYTKIQEMPYKQFRAGIKAINYLKSLDNSYLNATVIPHKEKFNTACPGKYFPIESYKNLLNN